MATNMAESSGSANARSHARNQPPPAQPAPPGFESFYLTERSKLTTGFEAFVLPLHWGLVRGGLRLRTNDANPTAATIPMSELSEMMPSNWKSKITTKTEEGSDQQLKQLVLRYWDCSNSSIHYEAKILEVVKNNAIVVILFRAVNAYGIDGNVQVANKIDMDSNSPTRNSSATNFQVGEYLTPLIIAACPDITEEYSLSPAENKPWYEIYKNLQGFEKLVWEQLMDPIGLTVSGKVREPGPYESKATTGQDQNQQNSQSQHQQQIYNPMAYLPPPPSQSYPAGGIGGPLYVPPAVPMGGGGLGRSDLDPLGGFGAGNVADPRGFRAPPALPFGGGIGGGMAPPPPGARFDPFGPPNPLPPPGTRPQPGTAGQGGANFAVPNPDAEHPPPGFEDMFM